jgi:SAM-dependent methyltransferase
MYSTPLGPHEAALRSYFTGDKTATLNIKSDLGENEDLPIAIFFREPADFFPFEQQALAECRGRVLDLGAGTGVHSLELQARGMEVCAVELLEGAAQIMRERGVRSVVCGDFMIIDLPPADTILMLMNGIGPVGTLDRLPALLERLRLLLAPHGAVLLDSAAANIQPGYERLADDWPPRTGEYEGEAWVRLTFRGETAPPFRELYVDFDTLATHVRASGWTCEQIYGDGPDHFVARLQDGG